MGMGAAEELKLTYKFKCEIFLPPLRVEIDLPGGSTTRN
jgi:hypothetical protein